MEGERMAQATGTTDVPPFTVGIVLYDGCDLLDVAGPNEVFGFMNLQYGRPSDRTVQVITLAQGSAPVKAGGLTVTPQYAFGDKHPPADLLFVPGGGGD